MCSSDLWGFVAAGGSEDGAEDAERLDRAAAAFELLHAFALGVEVECRIGNAVYPSHYDVGWHITGTTGMIGAAAACSRLLGLDPAKTAMALGIAASQPIGVREQFGTMTKPFQVAWAAHSGITAVQPGGGASRRPAVRCWRASHARYTAGVEQPKVGVTTTRSNRASRGSHCCRRHSQCRCWHSSWPTKR